MHYTWQNSASPIQEIRFSGGGKVKPEALIFAPLNGSTAAQNLDQVLAEKGLIVSYDIVENRPALRVSGFEAEGEVLKLLQENKMVEGDPQRREVKGEKESFDRLTASAVFYQLGNFTGLIGSIIRKDKDEITSNSAFIVGDSTMLAFGRKTTAEKQHNVMKGFGEILRQNGISVDPSSAFASEHIKDPPGLWNGIRRFMTDKVIAVKSVSEITAGIKKAQSGFNQNNAYKKIAGAALVTGFSSGLMIPEKTNAQLRDELDATTPEDMSAKISRLPFWKRVLTSIQRTPLILSGGFAGLNNLSAFIGALDERKHSKDNPGRSRQIDKIYAELGKNMDTGAAVDPIYEYKIFGFSRRESAIKKGEGQALEDLEKAKIAYAADPSTKNLKTFGEKQERVDGLLASLDKAKMAKDKNLWIFDLVQAVFFGVANTLYSISPKGGSLQDRQKLSERFFAAAATEIARAPAEKKEYLFAIACQYAGHTRELSVTSREAQEILAQKVQMLQANPWLNKQAAPQVNMVAESQEQEKPQVTMPKELLKQPVEERLDHPAAQKPAAASSFASVVGQKEPVAQRSFLEFAEPGGFVSGVV